VLADDQVYVGSTCNFATRKNLHKSGCNNGNSTKYNLKVYQTIRDNGGWENWRMDYVEQLPNHTLVQSKIREQYYINLFKAKLNSCNAYTDRVAYIKEYHDTHKEDKKEYHQKHKEQNNKHSKDYYYKNQDKLRKKINCNCGGHYQHARKAEHFKTNRHQSYLSCLPVKEDFPVVEPLQVTA
tara:strand:- start:10 stop:555 length:546 start_codon:yes stop_codon:yes gene_type:complete